MEGEKINKTTAAGILGILNQEVEQALQKRARFLDENMHLFAEFQIGEKVYNTKSQKVGVCIRHYRYWTTQNRLYDTSFDVDCEIQDAQNSKSFGNTSRFMVHHPWVSLADFQNKSEKYLQKLENIASLK